MSISTLRLPVLTVQTVNEFASVPVCVNAVQGWLEQIDQENRVLADCLRGYPNGVSLRDQLDFFRGAAVVYTLLNAQALADELPAMFAKRS